MDLSKMSDFELRELRCQVQKEIDNYSDREKVEVFCVETSKGDYDMYPKAKDALEYVVKDLTWLYDHGGIAPIEEYFQSEYRLFTKRVDKSQIED